jgi:hypothetical protein
MNKTNLSLQRVNTPLFVGLPVERWVGWWRFIIVISVLYGSTWYTGCLQYYWQVSIG